MPAALDIDREAVRLLIVSGLGVRQAAREMGIPEDTVLAWSARYGWTQKAAEIREKAVAVVRAREEARGIVQSSAIKAPVDALATVMEELGARSRIGFAKASAKVAEDLADATPDKLILVAQEAQQWAKTAALAHGWQAVGGATVNVAVALRLDME